MKHRFRSDMPVSAYVSKNCTKWVKFGETVYLDTYAGMVQRNLVVLDRRVSFIEVSMNVRRNGRIVDIHRRFMGNELGKRRAAQFLLEQGYLPYE